MRTSEGAGSPARAGPVARDLEHEGIAVLEREAALNVTLRKLDVMMRHK